MKLTVYRSFLLRAPAAAHAAAHEATGTDGGGGRTPYSYRLLDIYIYIPDMIYIFLAWPTPPSQFWRRRSDQKTERR